MAIPRKMMACAGLTIGLMFLLFIPGYSQGQFDGNFGCSTSAYLGWIPCSGAFDCQSGHTTWFVSNDPNGTYAWSEYDWQCCYMENWYTDLDQSGCLEATNFKPIYLLHKNNEYYLADKHSMEYYIPFYLLDCKDKYKLFRPS